MRRWSSIVILLAACAPAAGAPSGPGPQAPSEISRNTGGYDVRLRSDAKPVEATLPVSPARLWPIALRAYTSVGLRADVVDSVGHRVETRRLMAHFRMANHRLSSLFDCGTNLTGDIADSWRLAIDAQMAVVPEGAPDRARVAMSVMATATPVGGSGSSVTPCSSSGRLEAMLLDSIHGALAR